MRADANGIIRTEPIETHRNNGDGGTLPAVAATEGVEFDWNKWLNGWLDNERAVMIPWFEEQLKGLGDELLDLIEPHLKKIRDLELKLAELGGAVDILRGVAPPPPAKFPTIRVWKPDTIYHEGAIVAFAGGTWQAQCDTARVPGAQDWVCLASAGHSFAVRGTFNETAEYHRLDVVALNGSSFIALRDQPGACPGDGWQLLASCGKRGEKGGRGAIGPPGPAAPSLRWLSFDSARMALVVLMADGSSTRIPLAGVFRSVRVDPSDYSIKVTMTDGAELAFSVRSLFEKFLDETTKGR
jgi:hypothetical protein